MAVAVAVVVVVVVGVVVVVVVVVVVARTISAQLVQASVSCFGSKCRGDVPCGRCGVVLALPA